jgi:hypothetical protein
MNSLRDIVESSPQLRVIESKASLQGEETPQSLGPALWDWQNVRKILIVRLRSIGDTVPGNCFARSAETIRSECRDRHSC